MSGKELRYRSSGLPSRIAGEHDLPAGSVRYVRYPQNRADGHQIVLVSDSTVQPPAVIAGILHEDVLQATTRYDHAELEAIGNGDYKQGIAKLWSALGSLSAHDLLGIDLFASRTA